MKLSHTSLLLFAFALGGPAIAETPSESLGAAKGYEVVSAEFGLFNSTSSTAADFAPTAVVPLTPNQGYGWVMRLRTAKPKIQWREEFTLPASPGTWGVPEPLGTRAVSEDGRTSVTEREVSPDQGLIYNSWAVAPGDPKGRYVIRVFVEGDLAKVFEFDVQ